MTEFLDHPSVPHSNIYISGLPDNYSEGQLHSLFAAYGQVEACRIARHPHTRISKGFGFVKLGSVAAAAEAVAQLNGTSVDGHQLRVKPAESDTSQRATGLHPSDNLYVRSIPPDWTQENLEQLFSAYGAVVDCRLLASTVSSGRGALVRMANIEQASAAVEGESGLGAPASGIRLQVRFADTPEEKRLKRANRVQGQRMLPQAPPPPSPQDLRLSAGFPPYLPGSEPLPGPGAARPAGLNYGALAGPPQAVPGSGLAPEPRASVYVKNLPAEATKLWLYEHFAPQGGILSVKVLEDPATRMCRGVGFVNFTSSLGAMAAVQALHGHRVGDKVLHVSLQSRVQGRRS